MGQALRRFTVWLAFSVAALGAWAADDLDARVAQAAELRRAGQTRQALALLTAVPASASDARLSTELGLTLAQERRYDEARAELSRAHSATQGPQRAALALELGSLALQTRDEAAARQLLNEAAQLGDARVRLAAGLNLARTQPEAERLNTLQRLVPEVAAQPDATLALNLGHQAQQVGATDLAWRALDQSRRLAPPGSRTQTEALDALAQLYEAQGRPADALALNLSALNAAAGLPTAALGELPVAMEWRSARLYQELRQPAAALAAYQRAADRLEALRPDIPIELDDGSASYASLFEPIYLGLAEALLDASEGAAPAQRADLLRRARDAIELMKQTEMQDFLGDRCAVDAVKGGSATVIPPGTAVVYAVLLPQRLELLVETAQGLQRFTERISRDALRGEASRFATALRGNQPAFLPLAQQLYSHLLRPLEGLLQAQGITTLVMLPDSALRMVPMGALHDGRRFIVEAYALGSVAGLSMTNTAVPQGVLSNSLLAGVANFGPVVERLLQTPTGKDLARQVGGTERSLRESLALPGVTREIATLGRLLPGSRLLDERFTVEAFGRATRSGRYRVVHVASHGVFGGDAGSSFMLAYDDLLTLNNLEQLLGAEGLRRHGLELLTLSACETAEGNERAPLGISGAAIRARAKSVLGTLWPVDDDAAVQLMQRFYTALAEGRTSKAEALRQAQRELLMEPRFAHPFFWAPFTLIGNWL